MAYVNRTPTHLDNVYASGRSNRKMSRTMRRLRQRQRSVNDNIRLQKRKRMQSHEEWQATQIQIWHRMNDEALLNEKRLRNVSQPIDKPEVKLI